MGWFSLGRQSLSNKCREINGAGEGNRTLVIMTKSSFPRKYFIVKQVSVYGISVFPPGATPVSERIEKPQRFRIHPPFVRKGASPLRRRHVARFMPTGCFTPIQELSQRCTHGCRCSGFQQPPGHRSLVLPGRQVQGSPVTLNWLTSRKSLFARDSTAPTQRAC